MLVKNWMSKKVVSVGVDDSMSHAMSLTKEHQVRMLPVLKDGALVGVLSDTDIKRASASDATTLDVHELHYLVSQIKVGSIMTKHPITVPWDFTIEEAAEIMLESNISGVPVIGEKNQVVGVITRNDIFRALTSLSALRKKGIQFAFLVEDRPGSIKELTDIMRGYGSRIASILSSQEGVAEGYRKVYIRAYDVNRVKLRNLLEELKKKAALRYVVDHRENRREIYS